MRERAGLEFEDAEMPTLLQTLPSALRSSISPRFAHPEDVAIYETDVALFDEMEMSMTKKKGILVYNFYCYGCFVGWPGRIEKGKPIQSICGNCGKIRGELKKGKGKK